MVHMNLVVSPGQEGWAVIVAKRDDCFIPH
jgi:hypothetical protein